jgi:hypothetical protein
VGSSCPAHLTLRILITLPILGKEYKLQKSSLCNIPGILREVSKVGAARDFIYLFMLFRSSKYIASSERMTDK